MAPRKQGRESGKKIASGTTGVRATKGPRSKEAAARHAMAPRKQGRKSGKKTVPRTIDDVFPSCDDVPGYDAYESDPPAPLSDDTLVQKALLWKEKLKLQSEKEFEHLENFLKSNGFGRAEDPYKAAMKMVERGENIDRETRVMIAKYIIQKLGSVHGFFYSLVSVKKWGDTVAGHIVGTIEEEVTSHLGVVVTELEKIYRAAQEYILNQPDKELKLALGGSVKRLVEKWIHSLNYYIRFEKDWVEKPTITFSTSDPDGLKKRSMFLYSKFFED